MGFLKRMLGREEEPASPFGEPEGPPAASPETPAVSFHSPPAETGWSTVSVNGQTLPAEQAQAFGQAFAQLGNLGSLGSSQVIDLRGVAGLREKVLGAMSEHANDPAALQGAVMAALKEAGVQVGPGGVPALGTVGQPGAVPPTHGDPLERLEKLDELRKKGLITDADFAAQKKRVLDEI